MKKTTIEIFAYVLLAALTASSARADTNAAYQPRMDGDGWEILFDGKNLDAWDYQPESGVWKINAQDELYPAKPGSHIHTKQRYCDFVLELDYKMAQKQKSNSGVFFRVHDAKNPIKTGMQMQILDNADYGVPFNADNANGALYGLVCPAVDANIAIGQWNHCRITARDNQIIIELNGKEIVKTDLNQWTTPHTNPDGSQNKCPHIPDVIGTLPREGLILLENYGAVPMWFRNIRIKPLTDRKPQYTGKELISDVLRKR